MRLALILRAVGVMIGISSMLYLPSFLLAWAWQEHTMQAFAWGVGLTFLVSSLCWVPTRNIKGMLRTRDALVVVTLTWAVISLIAAVPIEIALPKLSFAQAVFETTSGLTTTGATVISGLDSLPKSLLLFRQMLNFFGGLGIIILAIAVLPMLGVGSMNLFRAEVTGHNKQNHLAPRVKDTARALWVLYLSLNALCALAYWMAGMSPFDAICHALSTISTGGFSTHDASFGYFNAPLLDYLAIIFMLAGATSFSLHVLAWRQGHAGMYPASDEWRSFMWIFVVTSLLVALMLLAGGAFDAQNALRHGFFQTASNITSTGFGTTGFSDWPMAAPLLLIIISFVGGCAGSTAGGIKVSRIMVAARQGLRELRQTTHPHAAHLIKINHQALKDSVVLSIGGFIALYLLSFALLTLVLNATGLDILTASSAIIACLNNLGPGLGKVAASFEHMHDFGLWVCCFAMLLGRLELFGIMMLFLPSFWRE